MELLAYAAQIARVLFVRLEPGEHIAIWSPNSPRWVLSEFGAALAGMTLLTVNPAFQSKELAYVVGQSKSVGLIVAPAYGITILSGGSGGGAGRFLRGGGFSGGGGRSAGGSASGN